MNKKEIFYKVAKHLMKQGRRAVSSSGLCQYLADDGTKCAVGCLIPKKYNPKNLNGGVYGPVNEVLGKLGLKQHTEFLHELQVLHDAHEPSTWGTLLTDIARERKWKIPDCVRA